MARIPWPHSAGEWLDETNTPYPMASRDYMEQMVRSAYPGVCRSGGAGATRARRALCRDASEGKGPQRRPQRPLDRRLEEVAKAVGGGYCRLQMPLGLALAVSGTVAGHRLGALERGEGVTSPPSNASLALCLLPRLFRLLLKEVGGSEAKKKFVYLKSASTFGPFDKFQFCGRNFFLMWGGGGLAVAVAVARAPNTPAPSGGP